MSEIYWSEGKKEKAKNILENILSIYPNKSIRIQLAIYNLKDKINLEENINYIRSIIKDNSYNPELYKLLAEGYTLTGNLFKSKLALVNYYDLKGNMSLAFKVIDDAVSSNKLSENQKGHLKKLKNSILCSSNPPLEPIFGNKTCN